MIESEKEQALRERAFKEIRKLRKSRGWAIEALIKEAKILFLYLRDGLEK